MTPVKTYVNEVTLENEEHHALTKELKIIEARIEAAAESVDVITRFKETAIILDEVSSQQRAKFSVDDIYALEGIYYAFRFNTNLTELADESLADYIRRRDALLKTFAEKKERLSETPNVPMTIKLADIREKLTRVSFLKPKSVKLYTLPRPYTTIVDPWVTFNTAPVLCTIDKRIQDSFDWLSTPHEHPSIKLGGTKVSANLSTGKLIVAPTPTRKLLEKQRFVTSYNSAAVHPHCLDHHEPCLGDFAGPFREAISDKDWIYAATVIGLFLSSASWDDSAGYYFHAGYGNILSRIEGISSRNVDISNACTYYINDIQKEVSFEEMDVPGDYIVRINDQEYKYCPSINYIEQVE